MIRGAGGGGKGGGGGTARAPVEAPDSLRSKQFARVLDLVSEGEIEGLVNGSQSIYLDDTPLQNSDGTFNFSGVTVASVPGTQIQSYIPGFPAVESENPVNVELTAASSITRQISNANVNKVRVTVAVPQLTQQNVTTGDLSGSTIDIAIDLQANGGGFNTVVADTISGKTTSRYQRSYEITMSGSAPWDIRLRRITADSLSAALINPTFWESYTEIIDSKLSYPNSAIIGIEVDASQFNAVPRRAFDLKGLKIQVPSNYDPETRVYTGIWDGTFQTAWSDNPAWCYYDILTNERYGLGNYIDASAVDKWSLFAIAQYCDELVSDGFGMVEPRFTCNLYLQTREEAFKVLANMASIFRGMTYWSAGAVTAAADMPSDAVALYTAANVIGGQFSYQGSGKNTRHTVALVSWNDPADAYRQKVEYVEDLDGIARYGVVETEIVAFGCTSRGQAHRMGRWLLYSERLETETVTFAVGLDGLFSAPGDIITTQDPMRAGVRWGGRITEATISHVTTDSNVTIEAGKEYHLAVMLPDGTTEERFLINGPATTNFLTPGTNFSQAPQTHAIWVLRSSTLAAQTWRVLAVTESGKAQFQILALKHNADKYDAVENNIILEPVPTSALSLIPPGVTNLSVTESLFEISSGIVSNRTTLSWTGTTGRYSVTYREELNNFVNLPETISQTIDIDGLASGYYNFSVQQINAIGRRGPTNTITVPIYGKIAPPTNVTGFTVNKSSGVALASWALHPDLDVRVGGRIEIRHEAVTSGAEWNRGVSMHTFTGNAVTGLVPLVTGTYMAKAMDSTEHFSPDAASFVITEGMVLGFTVAGTQTEAPTFSGTKTNCTVVSSELQLSGGTLFDDVAGDFDDATGLYDAFGGQAISATYAFGPLDLTTVATRRFEADIAFDSFDNADLFDEHQGTFDDADGLFDGENEAINDARVKLYASLTDDDPGGTPTWGDYFLFHVGDFTCRAARWRLDMDVETPMHNISVDTLTIHAKEPA